LRGSGRLVQSVAESSFDAWTKFYKQDANAANSIVSYYAKGSLIALVLDLKLRTETGGKVSLDHVMKECWKRWGETGEGMPETGFEAVCEEVSGIGLGDFFNATVRGTGELPLESMLTGHGVEMHLRPATGQGDKGGKPAKDAGPAGPWLGANVDASDGKLAFTVVHNGGPAEKAGVAPGDVAVALDGFALTLSNCDRRLRSYRDGDILELVLFRGDELITTNVELAARPENTCYLALAPDTDGEARSRRNAWLHVDQ
jgi:predicted metalloprotease with PDZ domain